jgi:hypothetical protein
LQHAQLEWLSPFPMVVTVARPIGSHPCSMNNNWIG